ncbi:hypothetical protein [Gordonia jinhuaensis]|uniref:hypothetical protein n=1 Tax=Gordonia jinhuaensis TaxID=1517702 RepID=UPI00166AD330|nr:hypothetical protein [Gordonia jinhuaensis]
MDAVLNWWDQVESWLTSLSFVPQLVVSLAVLIPLAIAAASALNLLVHGVLRLLDRRELPGPSGDRR